MKNFALSLTPKLKHFYFCAILPKLTVPCQLMHKPKEWVTDETSWMQRNFMDAASGICTLVNFSVKVLLTLLHVEDRLNITLSLVYFS